MKRVLIVLIGIVGAVALSGCGADIAGEEVVGSESGALTGISKGIRHDFDGDGKEDIIFYNSSGSYEYLGAAPGGFVPNKWVRTDLTPANVSYVAGDFNNDGKTDLLITTANGTYEYTGKTGGGFNMNVWTNTSLTLGNVQFTVGDFNGDNWTDIFVTTASGTNLYTGKGTGGTTQLGQIGSGFSTTIWGDSRFHFYDTNIHRGDFNGDGRDDFIASSREDRNDGLDVGTREQTGNLGPGGGFTTDVWSRPDLFRDTLIF